MFSVIWPFCFIDAVFDTQVWNSEVDSIVYNSCSYSTNIDSSPWYRVHAVSISAYPVAVVLPVLYAVRSSKIRSRCGVRNCCCCRLHAVLLLGL